MHIDKCKLEDGLRHEYLRHLCSLLRPWPLTSKN